MLVTSWPKPSFFLQSSKLLLIYTEKDTPFSLFEIFIIITNIFHLFVSLSSQPLWSSWLFKNMIYKLLYLAATGFIKDIIIKECSDRLCLMRHKSVHLTHLFASMLLQKVICLFKMFTSLANSTSICFWNVNLLHI